ncbi:ly6/PLAUR domain-containing protein 1-like isoform X2 [Girardinichthys multiradiatus]|nr:ly6/PLAUR domain-containing protein 1-like isoform X2 [Girardinichthys multiradiatus]
MTQDCATPEFIVNCTVNVQDMCQKEVLVKDDGIHYRKSCASSGACLIASSGYQQFCTNKLNSVCITCCNTPLCNGPRQKKRNPSSSSAVAQITLQLLLVPVCILLLLLDSILC